jgi:hypothetical protein
MSKKVEASEEAPTQTATETWNYNRRGRYGCQASRSRGTNWKITPRAWWPELPGKDMPKGWDLTWKPVYDKDTKRYTWQGAAKISGKRLCLQCRVVAVTGIQRYCRACAKSRKRHSTAGSMSKHRSSVRKTGFSPIQAEALTNEDLKVGYYHTGKAGNFAGRTGKTKLEQSLRDVLEQEQTQTET